jgi:ribosomal protein L37E
MHTGKFSRHVYCRSCGWVSHRAEPGECRECGGPMVFTNREGALVERRREKAKRELAEQEGRIVRGVDWGKGESFTVERTHDKPTR